MKLLLKYRNLFFIIIIGIFILFSITIKHHVYPTNQIECVDIANKDIQQGSINTSSGPNNNGNFYSFDIKKASYIQCASNGKYFQYEVKGQDAEGNTHHFYRSFTPAEESNSAIDDYCIKINNDSKGYGSKGKIIAYSEKSSASTYLGDPTCAYQEGLLQSPTSTYKSF